MKMQDGTSSLHTPSGVASRGTIYEAQEDLKEFNATKETVTELLNYKKTLIEMGSEDFDKINEIKSRAIEAINNLFNDIIHTPKNV